MKTKVRDASNQAHPDATALAAASALRAAAALTDPTRRADAVWDVLGRLRRRPCGAAAIVERLEDDGRGEAGIPDRHVLLVSARELEELVSTAWGIDGNRGPDPGRVRSPALRADHPTAFERRRHRHRGAPSARRRAR